LQERKIIDSDTDAARKIYPDLPCHVANEAEFIAAVDAGIASLEDGPAVDHSVLFAELRQIIHGKA